MLLERLPSYTDHVVFVGSFSEASDKLSQWRAYCSPGGGFSIGFDPGVIEQQAKGQDFRLLKCEYAPEKQKAICQKMISEACESAHGESDPAIREAILDNTFFRLFMVTAPALKNPSFEEEHEWRLVRGPFLRLRNIYSRPEEEDDENFIPQLVAKRDDLRFRPGKYAVIPYLNFALAVEGARLEVEQIRKVMIAADQSLHGACAQGFTIPSPRPVFLIAGDFDVLLGFPKGHPIPRSVLALKSTEYRHS